MEYRVGEGGREGRDGGDLARKGEIVGRRENGEVVGKSGKGGVKWGNGEKGGARPSRAKE